MDTVHTILIIILILMIIFNIYYALYVKRECLEGFEAPSGQGSQASQGSQGSQASQASQGSLQQVSLPDPYDITLQRSYANESIFDGHFVECTGPLCTTTVNAFEAKNPDFLNKHSMYHNTYSYGNIVNTSVGYGRYIDVMSRKSLFAYRCLKVSPKALSEALNASTTPFAHIYKKVYIYNEDMLVDFIKKQIQAVVNMTCQKYDERYEYSDANSVYCDANIKLLRAGNRSDLLQSPVYVIVSQSPYLRINEENKARFDIVKHQLPYFVEETVNGNKITQKMTGDEQSNFSSLYAEVLIVFPFYTFVGAERDGIREIKLDVQNDDAVKLKDNRFKKFMQLVDTYVIHDELCLLKCNKGELKCGCLNARESDMDFSDSVAVQRRPYINKDFKDKSSIKKYNSVCLSPQDLPTDRSVMYYVNPYSGVFFQIMNNSFRS